MFCSTSVKNFVQKKTQTYYYKRESKKEMPVQIPQNISLQNIFASQSQTATKRLIEEKAGCIYQNYKGNQFELDAKTTEANKELSEEEILMYSMFIDDNLYKKKTLKKYF